MDLLMYVLKYSIHTTKVSIPMTFERGSKFDYAEKHICKKLHLAAFP